MKTKLLAPHDEVLWKLSFVEFHLFITSGRLEDVVKPSLLEKKLLKVLKRVDKRAKKAISFGPLADKAFKKETANMEKDIRLIIKELKKEKSKKGKLPPDYEDLLYDLEMGFKKYKKEKEKAKKKG